MDKYSAATAMRELSLAERNRLIALAWGKVLDLRPALDRKAFERNLSAIYKGPSDPKGAA